MIQVDLLDTNMIQNVMTVTIESASLICRPGCMSALSRRVMQLLVLIKIQPSCDSTPPMTFNRKDNISISR